MPASLEGKSFLRNMLGNSAGCQVFITTDFLESLPTQRLKHTIRFLDKKRKKRMDMRQRQLVLQFRTPQHPSSRTNNWGGASPLLARNIPEGSLEQRYSRLNHNRNCDEIFRDHHFFYVSKKIEEASKYDEYECEFPPPPGRKRLLWKLIWRPSKDHKIITLGLSKKKRILPRLDWKKKWPNGWC